MGVNYHRADCSQQVDGGYQRGLSFELASGLGHQADFRGTAFFRKHVENIFN